MSWRSRVVWSEGMFLRPQHFQQQDRHVETLVQQRSQWLHPYDWGVARLRLDQEALALGKIAIAEACGLLPDGTPFHIPDHDEPPPALEIDPAVRDVRVLLAIPLSRVGMPEFASRSGAATLARYRISDYPEVQDTNVDQHNNAVPMELGQRRLRLLLAGEHDDYATIGVAKVAEQLPDRRIVLDRDYLPPCLDCEAVPPLKGFIEEILGLLRQRGEALADRLTAGARGGLEIAQFQRLQVINRFEPVFAHLATQQRLHPQEFYTLALQLAGELATFLAERRPPRFPAYEHDDLQKTFEPVIEELRRSLSMVEEEAAIQIPIEERQYGVRVAIITDRERNLLTSATFILAVHAEIAPDKLRAGFPPQMKIGPVERIAHFVNHHLPGIGLTALPIAPREIPYRRDFVYFELDRSSEFWKQLRDSGGFAFHVGGDFPGLEMTFWAIKERKAA